MNPGWIVLGAVTAILALLVLIQWRVYVRELRGRWAEVHPSRPRLYDQESER